MWLLVLSVPKIMYILDAADRCSHKMPPWVGMQCGKADASPMVHHPDAHTCFNRYISAQAHLSKAMNKSSALLQAKLTLESWNRSCNQKPRYLHKPMRSNFSCALADIQRPWRSLLVTTEPVLRDKIPGVAAKLDGFPFGNMF